MLLGHFFCFEDVVSLLLLSFHFLFNILAQEVLFSNLHQDLKDLNRYLLNDLCCLIYHFYSFNFLSYFSFYFYRFHSFILFYNPFHMNQCFLHNYFHHHYYYFTSDSKFYTIIIFSYSYMNSFFLHLNHLYCMRILKMNQNYYLVYLLFLSHF